MKRIGKYVITGLLGRGGMSVVYLARDPASGGTVALKVLCPHPNLVSLLGEDEVRRRFVSEARAIAALASPNVVEILDFDYDRGRPFFTMEYCYRDLAGLIGEGARTGAPCRILSLDRIIHYGRQLLDGLSGLHRAGIVHRDIKPANLLITGEDGIKICDFGLSRLRGERFGKHPGLMVGSPFYAAPEQERDPDRADFRADLYAAGVVFHRMLTGTFPEEDPPQAGQGHPDAGSAWDVFVANALRRDPEERYGSAEEMASALEALAAAWAKKKLEFCRLAPGPEKAGAEDARAGKLRDRPVKVRPAEAVSVFGCDRFFRPLIYGRRDFSPSGDGLTVFDRSTGLCWQRSGSTGPLSWTGAHDYIAALDREKFGGASGWRLPTVSELLSILRPVALGAEDCIEPVFDPEARLLWSADRRTFVSAWYVDAGLGFAGWAGFTCRFFVKAVRSNANWQQAKEDGT
jgi:tRNA A-37 threonylcarbamoyl transferase component Bud32